MAHSARKRHRVYKRDGFRCLKCHTTNDLTLDHIIPKCFGGQANEGNLQTLCQKCNEEKGHEVGDYRFNRKMNKQMNKHRKRRRKHD